MNSNEPSSECFAEDNDVPSIPNSNAYFSPINEIVHNDNPFPSESSLLESFNNNNINNLSNENEVKGKFIILNIYIIK